MEADTQLPDETFGRRIQRLRRDLRLTQRNVASTVDIDFTYLSKLENDRGETPSEETVRKLAKVLKTDEEDLLASAGKIPPSLRDRAQKNLEFARFLRRLPGVPEDKLQDIYRELDKKPRKR
jgi:transcriptional regulator with XRE-family HTH domain